MYRLVLVWCFVAIATAVKESPKRDSILSSIDSGEIHNFDEGKGTHEHEIRSAFPIMDAFKGHTLLTADDLKDKREYDYGDESTIDKAVRNALRKLHKKKKLYNDAISKANQDVTTTAVLPAKKNITARELVDQVVRDELKKHGHNEKESNDKAAEEFNDSNIGPPPSSDDDADSFEKNIHKKLAQISSLENKLTSLVTDVKKYLRKKKSEDPSSDNFGSLQDNDDVDRILAYSGNKRNQIPRSHIELLQKFRNNPELVDKYIDGILDSKDENTANGEQRDLLRKKETESALLRDAVPGDINSIPLSRLEKESDDYDNMATDRGIARDALIESPFSMLDIKKTTGKKFRHDIT
ncbi:uncharacterized protein LOC110252428 [Exaiptasia diaphana]|uniref:Uncharacterized protein n=1 Tax=Exaiptasia diaphana TaxID=2652724 RepID=A0A913Y618_EXADI|nr:uncharacterized protein LOC110252428 [Exaiptasia diaphana]KXJ28991.1 hypothetical protein AC249_AIPGENE1301 [Exaiptasia diaphana]